MGEVSVSLFLCCVEVLYIKNQFAQFLKSFVHSISRDENAWPGWLCAETRQRKRETSYVFNRFFYSFEE